MSGCCAPTFGTAGPRLPTRSRSTHGAPIQKRQLSGANAARDETSHACGGRSARAEPPICPRGREGKSGGLTPPPWVPRSRAETSATSAERRRTRPTPSTHTHTPRPHRRFVYINRTILSQCGFLNNETRSSQVREKRRAIVRSPEHCTKDQDQTHNGWNLKNNRTEPTHRCTRTAARTQKRV